MKKLMAVLLAVIAMLLALSEGRAQMQNPIPPRLSVTKAQYFKNNPAAWSQFLSQLPRPPVGPPQANPQPVSPPVGGTWTAVTTSGLGSVSLSNPLLLTDGTVIVHDQQAGDWWKLTPDSNGNYATGSWTQIASMPSGYGPLYFASAVLPDGRVITQGGEYNVGCAGPVWISLGAIYDPVANTWTSVSPPSGWGAPVTCGQSSPDSIGDGQSIVLPNGTFMLGACCGNPSVDALLNPSTLAYSSTGAPPTYQDEQGYTLLSNNLVLTIDVWDPNATHVYNYGTGTWSAAASTPVSLIDPCGNFETGPALTRPDGTTVAFGGNTGCNSSPADPTAIYTASSNSWVQGPNIPAICGSNGTTSCTLADAPAALLPNGNILFAASSGYGASPTHFFEFTGANAINQVADPIYFASSSGAYYYNFLVLPNGQILMTDFSNIAEVYTPSGSANSAWAPTISSAPSCVAPGSTYTLAGTQLNGLSQGAAYGDDVQGATNFPLVRIVNNSTGLVYYARTSNFSTMSIASGQSGSTSFKVASATATGASTLYVIANGIASAGKSVTVSSSCSNHLIATPNSGPAPLAVSFTASGLPLPMTYTINFGDGTTGALIQSSCIGVTAIVGGQSGIQCAGSASHIYAGVGAYGATLLNALDVTVGTAAINVTGAAPTVGIAPPDKAATLGSQTIPAMQDAMQDGSRQTLEVPSAGSNSTVPTISSFTASPASISPFAGGGSATLSWSAAGAASLSISGLGTVIGNSIQVSPSQTTTYTLTASNAQGAVTAQTTVTVAGYRWGRMDSP